MTLVMPFTAADAFEAALVVDSVTHMAIRGLHLVLLPVRESDGPEYDAAAARLDTLRKLDGTDMVQAASGGGYLMAFEARRGVGEQEWRGAVDGLLEDAMKGAEWCLGILPGDFMAQYALKALAQGRERLAAL